MVTVKLYVEGATQKNDLERTHCREAFSAFFAKAEVTIRPRVVPYHAAHVDSPTMHL